MVPDKCETQAKQRRYLGSRRDDQEDTEPEYQNIWLAEAIHMKSLVG